MQRQKGAYTISTDKTMIQLDVVHHYLAVDSYWAEQIPVDIVLRSIENSLCFGLYYENEQVGFARVVTDTATFAYLGDVFILPPHRGKGLSKWLMTVILEHPQLQGLRRFLLTTRDAHSLYAQFGFAPYPQPDRIMAINTPDMYKSKK